MSGDIDPNSNPNPDSVDRGLEDTDSSSVGGIQFHKIMKQENPYMTPPAQEMPNEFGQAKNLTIGGAQDNQAQTADTATPSKSLIFDSDVNKTAYLERTNTAPQATNSDAITNHMEHPKHPTGFPKTEGKDTNRTATVEGDRTETKRLDALVSGMAHPHESFTMKDGTSGHIVHDERTGMTTSIMIADADGKLNTYKPMTDEQRQNIEKANGPQLSNDALLNSKGDGLASFDPHTKELQLSQLDTNGKITSTYIEPVVGMIDTNVQQAAQVEKNMSAVTPSVTPEQHHTGGSHKHAGRGQHKFSWNNKQIDSGLQTGPARTPDSGDEPDDEIH